MHRAAHCKLSHNYSTRLAGRSSQRPQQRLGVLEVGGIKALSEPAVDGFQQRVGFGTLALALPQAREAYRGTQLPRLRLLAVGYGECLLETGFCLVLIRDGLLKL